APHRHHAHPAWRRAAPVREHRQHRHSARKDQDIRGWRENRHLVSHREVNTERTQAARPLQLGNHLSCHRSGITHTGDTHMSTPNNLNRIPELDADNMLGHIDALPDQLEAAWARAHELELPFDASGLQQVVISGMGGSAISGDLLATLVAPVCPIPVVVYRGYDLPAYATGPGTLVVALSHSGGTEEVLSVARQAAARGAR